MGSRRTYVALRRRSAIALGVWAVAFSMLAAAAAVPEGLKVSITVSSATPLVDQTVRFNASVGEDHEDGSGHRVSYHFDFGDGTGTDWQTSSNTTHAYTTAGNYTASVTAEDKDGHSGSASVRIQVLPAVLPVPDVRPVFATWIPLRPAVGDSVNLTIILLNRGTASARTATVGVTDARPDGATASLGNVTLTQVLAPSSTTPVMLGPFRASGVGNHTLRIRVTGVTPSEANPPRGMLNVTMTVIASPPPPPVLTGPQLRLVAGLLDPPHPNAGDSVNLTVVVWNGGTAVARRATLAAYDVRPNGTVAFVDSVPLSDPLPPSMGEIVSFPAFFASVPGNHTLRVLVENVIPPQLKPGDSELDLALTVAQAIPPPPNHGAPPFEFGPLAIALAGAAVVSGGAAALLLRRPRRAVSLEPPPATPPDRSPPPIWPP